MLYICNININKDINFSFIYLRQQIKKRKIKEKKVLTSLPNRDTIPTYRKDESLCLE